MYTYMYYNIYDTQYCVTILWSSDRGGSIPSATVLKLKQLCLSQILVSLRRNTQQLLVFGPSYLVSMSGEAKDPTQG